VDTSAYLCILLAEDGWEALSAELAGGEMMSSVLLLLDANRNLIRLTRERTLTTDQYESCTERLRQDPRATWICRCDPSQTLTRRPGDRAGRR
jgi:hypothetical protein